jgi:hypothetical protein
VTDTGSEKREIAEKIQTPAMQMQARQNMVKNGKNQRHHLYSSDNIFAVVREKDRLRGREGSDSYPISK